jgi:beta-N-acetylhexosaminidase
LLHFNRVESFDPDAVLMSDELVALVDEVAATEVPVAAVSMGTPYALSRVREAAARLCSYSTCDASLRATLRVLKGESSAPGVLPVELQPIALAT